MKVGSVYYQDSYFHPESKGIVSPRQLDGIDLLIFWGGGDISTALYGQKNIGSSSPSYERDSIEVDVMREALGKIPILGICRGAQLACAMLGGELYQDVNNHTRAHSMVVREPYRSLADAPLIPTSSLHHQMMILPEGCEIVAEAPGHSTVRRKFDVKRKAMVVDTGYHIDPEVAFNRDKKVLMVQGHPEFSPHDSALTKLTMNLLNYLFGVKLY